MKDKTVMEYLPGKRSFFLAPDYIEASAWIEHIPFAFWIIETVKPAIVVELGVHNGTSYFSFCQAVKTLNIDAVCYGVDTWQGDEHSGLYGEEVFGKVMDHNSQKYARFSTLIKSTFDEARDYFIDGAIDLLHLDGMHTYESVKHDFETWLPKLTPNAIVIFHDINVRERDFGVFKFWEEVRHQYRHFQFDFGHGLGILAMGEVAPEEVTLLLQANKAGEHYVFLRNLFYERGSSFKNKFETSLFLKQERENFDLQGKTLSQVTENYKTLEVNYNQLRESNIELAANYNQLQEKNGELVVNCNQLKESNTELTANYNLLQEKNVELVINCNQLRESKVVLETNYKQLLETNNQLAIRYHQLLETNKELAENNNQLLENYKMVTESNAKLKEDYASLETKNVVYQTRITELSEKLNVVNLSLNEKTKEISNHESTIRELKAQIQQQLLILRFYKDTYEDRSILGVLKEKVMSLLKKK